MAKVKEMSGESLKARLFSLFFISVSLGFLAFFMDDGLFLWAPVGISSAGVIILATEWIRRKRLL